MFIRKNPVTMVGEIDKCWLFAYQTAEEKVRPYLPAPLTAVTHRGRAFWNVVVCHVKGMRPKGLPGFTGVSYWHVAYRLYVQYPATNGGDAIEGLYFVRSDCDNPLMASAGNVMTDFNFHTAPVRVHETGGTVDIRVASPDEPARARLWTRPPSELPLYSAFDSLDEAAQFLKYKPAGISVDTGGNGNIVRIVRDEAAWKSRLVHIDMAHFRFMDDKDARPEICYEVEPITYQWNAGVPVVPDSITGRERPAFVSGERRAC